VNITIVGAGIVGCAIAHELASRGVTVRLVDERGAGLGATRASAGMLAPHIEGHLAPLLSLSVRSLAMYDEFVRRAARDSGQTIEYERSGTLQVARTAAEAAALCASARALGGHVDHALLDANETRQMEPQLAADVVGSLHVRDHAYVAATALTLALAAAAARQGAAAVTARVTSIEGGEAPRVLTSDGPFDADAVIIAAGTWSGHVSGQIDAGFDAPLDVGPGAQGGSRRAHGHAHTAVKPIRGQLLQLRLASRPASRVIWGGRCYLVPWRDGSVLAGATVEDVGFDETATASGVAYLLEASAELLPVLRGAVFEGVRVGLRPMTRDELPAIGPSSTMRNVFYATGHYRNGVLLAPLTAALVADLLLDGGRRPELALVRPDRLGL
jgi:glycine oxidase